MRAPAFWHRQAPTTLAWLLWPLAALYAGCAARHGNRRARNTYHAPVPVIAVGNLAVGGSGKTPLTQFLAHHLAGPKLKVAVVARGYGGKLKHATRVSSHHTAADVGDEPLLLSRRLKERNVQVWVGRNRPAAVAAAVKAGAKLIILDDAFQRRDVHRTINLLVVNGQTGLGNGLPMPAGPLREWPQAAARATHIAVINPTPGVRLPAAGAPVFTLTLGSQPQTLAKLKGKPVMAFAGLAHPQNFFNALRRGGLTLVAAKTYPDHHRYTETDLKHLKTLAGQHGATLVCTGKDSVKLPASFPHVAVPEQVGGPAATRLLTAIKKAL